ncbi:hypothetical protein [Nocardia sp. BMG51109]|uniref:hypothetical protein n=1 Tax=Nocardia sp. BMG51109 TaxID=1056816 RepID=UPI0004B38566|nr:hypothetical protein [Nocardia sp. BMG51109]
MTPSELHCYSAADRAELDRELALTRESTSGTVRLAVVAHDETELAERLGAARKWLWGESPRPAGTAYRDTPLSGGLAFTFPGSGVEIPGMGRELLADYPGPTTDVAARCGGLAELSAWAAADLPLEESPTHGVLALMQLGLLQAEIGTRILGLRPDAVIGYSLGETNGLLAAGCWPDPRALLDRIRTDPLFTREIGGEMRVVREAWRAAGIDGTRWSTYTVVGELDAVRENLLPGTRLMAVNAPGLCIIGGEATACAEVIETLAETHTAIALPLAIPSHVPELADGRPQLHRFFDRPTSDTGIRVYSCAAGDWYHPTRRAAARLLTDQALDTIDYPRVIERAYADGIRTFLELGPAEVCTTWIHRILGNRPHLAVCLGSGGTPAVEQLAAELAAAGVPTTHGTTIDKGQGNGAHPVPHP